MIVRRRRARCAWKRFSPTVSTWFAPSSLGCKNIPLRRHPKSPLQLPPSRPEKRGVGHRHKRWGGLRWTRQRQAREMFAGRFSVSEHGAQDERRLNAFAGIFCGQHVAGGRFWRGKPRTAKPCGPGTRCWCQTVGGEIGPTGRSAVKPAATEAR
jgi:hypothetical protein